MNRNEWWKTVLFIFISFCYITHGNNNLYIFLLFAIIFSESFDFYKIFHFIYIVTCMCLFVNRDQWKKTDEYLNSHFVVAVCFLYFKRIHLSSSNWWWYEFWLGINIASSLFSSGNGKNVNLIICDWSSEKDSCQVQFKGFELFLLRKNVNVFCPFSLYQRLKKNKWKGNSNRVQLIQYIQQWFQLQLL